MFGQDNFKIFQLHSVEIARYKNTRFYLEHMIDFTWASQG